MSAIVKFRLETEFEVVLEGNYLSTDGRAKQAALRKLGTLELYSRSGARLIRVLRVHDLEYLGVEETVGEDKISSYCRHFGIEGVKR